MCSRRYTQLSPAHLIDRLTARNLHLLALRISSYLSLKPDAVLKHWACAKIVRAKPAAADAGRDADDVVCRSIVEKFESLGRGEVSYAEIAKRAWEVGRAALATKVRAQYLVLVRCCVGLSGRRIVVARLRAPRVGPGTPPATYEGG